MLLGRSPGRRRPTSGRRRRRAESRVPRSRPGGPGVSRPGSASRHRGPVRPAATDRMRARTRAARSALGRPTVEMVVIGAGQQLGAIGVSAEQVSSCGEPLHVVGLQRCLTVGDQELVVGHAPGLPLERGPATYDRIRGCHRLTWSAVTAAQGWRVRHHSSILVSGGGAKLIGESSGRVRGRRTGHGPTRSSMT